MKKRQVLQSALSFFSHERARNSSQYLLHHLPLLLTLAAFLCHGLGIYRLPYIDRLDAWIYDARLTTHAPRTLHPHVVIVDIDEASLAAFGRWPWSRSTLAGLVQELTHHQHVAALGLDMVLAEAETPSADAALAKAISQQPVVLGYYFTSDRAAHRVGELPKPVLAIQQGGARDFQITSWTGYGANLPVFSQAAMQSGFINALSDDDGVIRSVPILAEYQGEYYESLALALYRRYRAENGLLPQINTTAQTNAQGLMHPYIDHVSLSTALSETAIPVDDKVAVLVPYRGQGGQGGGSFQYVSAKDILEKKLKNQELKDRVVIIGSSTPTLSDLRVTPMGKTYPGVEVHASIVAGLIDGTIASKPHYALGYELFQLCVLTLLLGVFLPRLTATGTLLLTGVLCFGLWLLHRTLHYQFALVLPMASGIAVCIAGFVIHTSYGFFQEGLRRQHLVKLFGSYVSPDWVQQMVRTQSSYSMQASNETLTVMFCDMRGFTRLAGQMAPLELQTLLNDIFNRLSHVIQAHGGTIDKYMGDCVMAFWGAPVAQHNHAARAVACAQGILDEVRLFNAARMDGTPEIKMGIGINTGLMCVGDMGSRIRRSYTVIGDAVNLASRLEGLCKAYRVNLIVSSHTQKAAIAQSDQRHSWIDLGSATIEGFATPVHIYSL